jgi:hypothetical protein
MIYQAKSNTAIEEWQILMDDDIPLPFDLDQIAPSSRMVVEEVGVSLDQLDRQAFSPTRSPRLTHCNTSLAGDAQAAGPSPPSHFSVRAQLAPLGRIFDAPGGMGGAPA